MGALEPIPKQTKNPQFSSGPNFLYQKTFLKGQVLVRAGDFRRVLSFEYNLIAIGSTKQNLRDF